MSIIIADFLQLSPGKKIETDISFRSGRVPQLLCNLPHTQVATSHEESVRNPSGKPTFPTIFVPFAKFHCPREG